MRAAVDERVALVTGSRRGIGLHVARSLVAQGYLVYGCASSPDGPPEQRYVALDVADEGAVFALTRRILRDCGRLDVLVTSAGVGLTTLTVATGGKSAERVIRTNFLGTFFACREAAKIMVRQKHGRIVTIASVAVPLAIPGQSIYAGSKAAVIAFTRVLAREMAPFGVTCNVVSPSPIETDILADLPREALRNVLSTLPLAEFGTLEAVTGAINFCIDDRSGMLTGQVISLGGG